MDRKYRFFLDENKYFYLTFINSKHYSSKQFCNYYKIILFFLNALAKISVYWISVPFELLIFDIQTNQHFLNSNNQWKTMQSTTYTGSQEDGTCAGLLYCSCLMICFNLYRACSCEFNWRGCSSF